MKRINYLVIFGLILIFVIRTIALDKFPNGITHDELNYIFSAKSLFFTHSFPVGTAPAVFSSNMGNPTVTIAEVPAIILAVFTGWMKFSLIGSRILGAILNTLISLAIYLIVKKITNRKDYAYFCLFLSAINPWMFLMGRTIFEVNFFICFFLWGFWLLIKNKGKNIFKALPFYLLGFFSYTGGQIVFYLFIISSLIYHNFAIGNKNKLHRKYYITFVLVMTLVLVGYLSLVFKNQTYKVRGSEIYTPFDSTVTEEVNKERLLSIPSVTNNLFINKTTIFIRGFVDKYLSAYSVNNLFINGEVRAAFSYQKHGNFYYLDALFLLLGFIALFKVNKKFLWFVLFVLFVGPITSGLSKVEYSYSQRSALIFPFLMILSGAGMGKVYADIKKKGKRKIFLAFVLLGYTAFFVNLMHLYFFRFPVYASDGWFFQDRVLSSYIINTQRNFPDEKIVVYTSEPKILFEEYLFYSNLYDKNTVGFINNRLLENNFSFGQVSFNKGCPQRQEINQVTIIEASNNCSNVNQEPNLSRITRLSDNNDQFVIINDILCKNISLDTYMSQKAYSDFSTEKLSSEKFCIDWISKYP